MRQELCPILIVTWLGRNFVLSCMLSWLGRNCVLSSLLFDKVGTLSCPACYTWLGRNFVLCGQQQSSRQSSSQPQSHSSPSSTTPLPQMAICGSLKQPLGPRALDCSTCSYKIITIIHYRTLQVYRKASHRPQRSGIRTQDVFRSENFPQKSSVSLLPGCKKHFN